MQQQQNIMTFCINIVQIIAKLFWSRRSEMWMLIPFVIINSNFMSGYEKVFYSYQFMVSGKKIFIYLFVYTPI